jgi:hypothetical protein
MGCHKAAPRTTRVSRPRGTGLRDVRDRSVRPAGAALEHRACAMLPSAAPATAVGTARPRGQGCTDLRAPSPAAWEAQSTAPIPCSSGRSCRCDRLRPSGRRDRPRSPYHTGRSGRTCERCTSDRSQMRSRMRSARPSSHHGERWRLRREASPEVAQRRPRNGRFRAGQRSLLRSTLPPRIARQVEASLPARWPTAGAARACGSSSASSIRWPRHTRIRSSHRGSAPAGPCRTSPRCGEPKA